MYASANKSISFLFWLLVVFLLVFVWSAVSPNHRLTWWLEVLPTMIALPILLVTYKAFPLTPMVYILILIHAIILLVGGHYTYAEVPLFNWLQDTFDLDRNYYDRIGHFAQGFVPAMIAREILIRKKVILSNGWLFFIVCSICLSISAFYEFVEWWVAIASGSAADAFLGTQGDIWDTQWDMLTALIGSICAQILLRKWHKEQIVKLDRND